MLLQEDGDVPQNTYKHVKIYPKPQLISSKKARLDGDRGSEVDKSFKPCVSFNTVPSYLGDKDGDDGLDFPGVQIPTEYTMEEFYDDESGFVSYNTEYFLRNQYMTDVSSFGGSPPPRNLSNKAAALSSMFRVAQNGKIVRVDYPTTPTIINDAIVINRAQAGWDKMWYERKRRIEKKLNDKEACYRYPDIIFKSKQAPKTRILADDGYTPLTKNERIRERILNEKVGFPNTPRTILCHISGRRHTWVALDWTMRKLAQDTDHIVVLANIPRFAGAFTGSNKSTFGSHARNGRGRRSSLPVDAKEPGNNQDDNVVEWTSGYRSDAISKKLEDLLEYIAVIVPKNIVVKVTVEIVIGKTKKIMSDAMNVYTPEFVTSTTLRWERTDNLILWKCKNLTDVLCTKYPVPVFVIPVKRMYELEKDLKEEFAPKVSSLSYDSSEASEPLSPTFHDQLKKDSESVPESPTFLIETPESESDSDFSDSSIDTAPLKLTSKSDLIAAANKHREEISRNMKNFENEQHESNVAKLLKKLDLILKSSLDFSLHVQNMTQEDEESGFEKLKRVITGGTASNSSSKRSMLDVGDAPKRSLYKNVSGSRPRNSQIKFASNVTSRDGNRALGNKLKPKSAESSPPSRSLSPSSQERPSRRSHEEVRSKLKITPSGNTIRKVRSTSNISRVKSNDSIVSSGSISSGKKKGGFLSLFKSSGSRSRSTSRRNSIGSSDNETISSSDSDAGKKRRSRLFGFS